MIDECTIAHSIEFPLYGIGRCQYELGGHQLLGKHHDWGVTVSQSLDHGGQVRVSERKSEAQLPESLWIQVW